MIDGPAPSEEAGSGTRLRERPPGSRNKKTKIDEKVEYIPAEGEWQPMDRKRKQQAEEDRPWKWQTVE